MRRLRLRVTARANADIDRAAAWWNENRELAPRALYEELDRALSLLVVQPLLGEPARCSGEVGKAISLGTRPLPSVLPSS